MRTLIGILIVIVGVLALVAGILYLTQPVHALPTFLPGYVAHGTGKRPTRGTIGIVAGAVLMVIGAVVAATGHRRARW